MIEIQTMTEAESFRRGVFPYSVGGVTAIADPLKALNRMYEVAPEFDSLVAKFFAGPAEAEDEAAVARRGVEMIAAATALEPAVLAGFKLRPLAEDGSGASVTECMALLASFLDWQDRRDAVRAQASAVPSPDAGTPSNQAA